MKLLTLKTKDPYLNLAIEEYLFLNSEEDIFMLWQNEPTVVIGKNQNAFAETDMAYIEKNNIHIARRITGGGAVYHDLGNLNYSYISSVNGDKALDFEYFTRPIIEVVSTLGIKAYLSGRNDILAEEKKFSGSAQYSFGGRTLHHGTLLFDSDFDVLTSALKVDKEKITSKGIKSVRSRVINLKDLMPVELTVDEFSELIEAYFLNVYGAERISQPTADEIARLRNRNASKEWLFPDRAMVANYTYVKKKRYDFGTVQVSLEMSNENIKDISIQGDFFGVEDINILENVLKGKSIRDIDTLVEQIDIDKYIFGATRDEFVKLIKE